jgi:hypothetical protein
VKNGFWTGLTGLLGGTCLALVLLAGLLALLLGGTPSVTPADDGAALAGADSLVPVRFDDRPAGVFTGAILEQPLFFADRRLPDMVDEQDAEALAAAEAEAAAAAEAVPQLDARLAGVIITPDKRLAMVADNKARKTVVLEEGMALEGDLAAWRLDRIDAREVSFAADGETAALELEVNTQGLKSPAGGAAARATPQRLKSPAGGAAARATPQRLPVNASAANSADPTQASSAASAAAAQRQQTADEIRRRIAERRAQLRAQRAREAAAKGDDDD